ncbi:MAG: glycosyltransferase family 39 protein [Chloroflexi bacterium]|nr:glycosyltransferase family 39 protein [Chloroflexota bacterium]
MVSRYFDYAAILAIIAVAVLVRLFFEQGIAPFVSKDSQSYFLPAWDLLRSGELQLGLRRTPGYPLFLSLLLAVVGEDLRRVALAQHLLGVGTAALTYLLGRLTFGRPVGLVGGLLVAISAPLLVYEHYILAEGLFTFVLTAALVGLTLGARTGRLRWYLFGGALVGLAALIRPIGQLVLPLALLAVAAAPPRSVRVGLASAGLVLAGFALFVVPWTIRNQLTHNLASPSTFGRTLIARTASYDRGFVFYDPDRPLVDADPERIRALQIVQQGSDRRQSDGEIATRLRQELDLGPVEVNAVMRDIALEAIWRQPGYFAEGTLRFAVRIFNGVEVRLRDHDQERRDVVWEERTRHLLQASPRSDSAFRTASAMLRWYQPSQLAPLQLVLFAIGLLAALVVPAWRSALVPGLMVAMLVLASAALDGPQERYRYPADPAIGVLAAGGALALVRLMAVGAGRLRGVQTSPSNRRAGLGSRGGSRTAPTASPSATSGAGVDSRVAGAHVKPLP